jgi:hypothetical protein
MNKFLVIYVAPARVLEEWMQKPEEERRAGEEKMKQEWDRWMESHRDVIKETAGVGKTKKVTKEGITETKNGIMLYSVVEGESVEAVAEMFQDHPHFGIPEASIEVMPVNYLS